MALHAILTHPKITADVLQQKRDPWQVPELATAIAGMQTGNFRNTPLTLPGHALDNMVGFYLHARPASSGKRATAEDVAGLKQAIERGELPQSIIDNNFYPNNESVQNISAKILRYADPDPPEVLPLPVTYFSRDTGGPANLTVFCVRAGTYQEDGSPRYVIIDNLGSVYEDGLDEEERRISCYDNFLRQNDMPSGLLVHPADPLRTGRNEPFKFNSSDTPETHKTGKHVFRAVALVGAVVATGAAVIGTGGMAGFVLAGVGTVSAGAHCPGKCRAADLARQP